jgi:hypothetical protein
MGLLDDLKKQAEMLKSQQNVQQNLQADKIKLVEEKMKQTFQYVNELLKQLAVLKPASPLVFTVPGVGELKGLSFVDSFIDYRRKRIDDKEYFDTINFYMKWDSGNTLVIEHDMPAATQRVRESLWASKLKFTEEEKKNAKGFAVGARFTVPVAMVTDVIIKADHDQGRLLMQARNLLGVGIDSFVMPAPEVSDAALEELARTLIGQASNFRKFRVVAQPGAPRTEVRRDEAQRYGRWISSIL